MGYDKDQLAKHRLARAYESIEDAKLAIENNRLFNAENRIYYTILVFTVRQLPRMLE